MRGACYINYWRSMFLALRNGVIAFLLSQFLLRQLKVCANQYLLPQGVRILHLHSQWVMHFKSLKRYLQDIAKIYWDKGVFVASWLDETLRVMKYSSHEYLYAPRSRFIAFQQYILDPIRHRYFPYVLIIDRTKICWIRHLE